MAEDLPILSPFYRRVDWWTFSATALVAVMVYLLTLAPEVTLEQSGQYVTASMWAAVPNPPGHPFWTIVTWFFVKLIPFSNAAYRVALASAVASALACGIVAMMVSRGSSLMIESAEDFKGIDPRRLSAICSVSGVSAGLMMGFTGVIWSQAVVVQTYALSVLLLASALALTLRWIYSPQRRRYIYLTAMLFGLCITSHQLMIVAMGLEVAIIAGDLKLGRDILGFNCLCWFAGACDKWSHLIGIFDGTNPFLSVLFHMIGGLSLLGFAALIFITRGFFTEWKSVLIMVALWFAGAAFYFYPALASMTNPPINWGYPRTVQGFWHVLMRGQYDRMNPIDFIHEPAALLQACHQYLGWLASEFPAVCLPAALGPFLFLPKMRKRERGWLIGLGSVFFCLSVLTLDLLRPSRDRQTDSLVQPFFGPSYALVALLMGCGFALAAAWMESRPAGNSPRQTAPDNPPPIHSLPHNPPVIRPSAFH